MKKIVRLIVIVFLSIIVIMTVLVPLAAKIYINKKGEELIGRKLELHGLRINPFIGSLFMKDFTMYEADKKTPFLHFDRLKIHIRLRTLPGNEIYIRKFHLRSPYVHIAKFANEFNFDNILPSSDTIDQAAKSTNSQDKWSFVLKNFHISGGAIEYSDSVLHQNISMHNLQFAIPYFSLDNNSSQAGLSFIVQDSSTVAVKTEYELADSSFIVRLGIQNLSLDIAEPYALQPIAAKSIKGLIGCALQAKIPLNSKLPPKIAGNVWMNQFSLSDTSTIPILQFDSLGFDIFALSPMENSYHIQSIGIKNPKMRFDVFDSTHTIMALFGSDQSTRTDSLRSDSIQPGSRLFYLVDSFTLVDGAFIYRDFSLETPFRYNLSNLTGYAHNIRSDSGQMNLHLTGILEEKGNIRADLQMSLTELLDLNLDMAIENFQMDDISPFSLHYSGHPVFDGDLLYLNQTTIHQNTLVSNNTLKIDRLEVGQKVGENFLVSLPLKFAVFLLKDKNGVVNLALPVDGNLNDPQFRIGPILWQVLKQNIEKVVAAPGKALASSFGIPEEKIKYIAFAPADTSLSAPTQEALDLLVQLRSQKTGLAIKLAYFENKPDDLFQTAVAMAKKQYIDQLHAAKPPADKAHLQHALSDTNIAFLHYLQSHTDSTLTNTDSLSLKLIGYENVLNFQNQVEEIRQQKIKAYLLKIDSSGSQAYSFETSAFQPEFPISESGYIIRFDMLPE